MKMRSVAKGQQRKSPCLLNHAVNNRKKLRSDCQPKRFGRLHVENQFEFRRQENRNIASPFSARNPFHQCPPVKNKSRSDEPYDMSAPEETKVSEYVIIGNREEGAARAALLPDKRKDGGL